MGLQVMIRYLIAWVAMLFIAVANGAFRQLTFGKYMSEQHAHQLSTAMGIFLLGVFIWAVIRSWPPSSASQAITIGVMWLFLTAAFEFLFGHFVAGHSWARLLHDYNLLEGRVWVLVLVWVTLAPYIFYRLR
jgi:hypothetical protein